MPSAVMGRASRRASNSPITVPNTNSTTSVAKTNSRIRLTSDDSPDSVWMTPTMPTTLPVPSVIGTSTSAVCSVRP